MPETYEVRADGELLTCEPADVLPMAQRYFMRIEVQPVGRPPSTPLRGEAAGAEVFTACLSPPPYSFLQRAPSPTPLSGGKPPSSPSHSP